MRGTRLLAVAAAMLTVSACQTVTRDAQPIGGGWYVERVTTGGVGQGTQSQNLRRRWGRGHFVVDERVATYRFVAPDCVVYSLAEPSPPWFAVCEDHTPVRLPDWIRDVRDDGVWGDSQAGRSDMAPIEAVVALAREQPPYKQDWTSKNAAPAALQKLSVERKP